MHTGTACMRSRVRYVNISNRETQNSCKELYGIRENLAAKLCGLEVHLHANDLHLLRLLLVLLVVEFLQMPANYLVSSSETLPFNARTSDLRPCISSPILRLESWGIRKSFRARRMGHRVCIYIGYRAYSHKQSAQWNSYFGLQFFTSRPSKISHTRRTRSKAKPDRNTLCKAAAAATATFRRRQQCRARAIIITAIMLATEPAPIRRGLPRAEELSISHWIPKFSSPPAALPASPHYLECFDDLTVH